MSGTKDTWVLGQHQCAPFYTETHFCCASINTAFKACHRILGQPGISPLHFHLVLEVQKLQNQLAHKQTYSASYPQSVSSCSASTFPPGCLGHGRPCTHPVCTQDTRPQQQSGLWQEHLISCLSTNSVNTPHTNQQIRPRLSLYRPTALTSKHPLLYLLTKEHWTMSFVTAGLTWAVTEETTDWWRAIFYIQLCLR